jgi:hypothetical protein
MTIRLPNAPAEYDIQFMNQYSRALEVAITQMQTSIQQLLKFIVPNYTTAQKNSLTPQAGQLVFDTTLQKLCVRTATGWQTVTSV